MRDHNRRESSVPSGVEDRGYRVSGRVQGVGFRWWTRDVASELGLVGTVRNRSDGSVEVKARGHLDALEQLEHRLIGGPAMARVDALESVECVLPAQVSGFSIEYRRP